MMRSRLFSYPVMLPAVSREILLRVLIISGLQFFAGCVLPASKNAEPVIPLEGTAWYLSSIGMQPIRADVGTPFIKFDSGHIYGFGGCNRMSGKYELVDRRIRMRQIAFTRLRCDDMSVEEAFFQSLPRCQELRHEGPRLTLMQQGSPILIFETRPETKP